MIIDGIVTDTTRLDPASFAGTGWTIEPEGACRGDICVPLAGAATLRAVAERLGMPIVEDTDHAVSALGPATMSGRALSGVDAPDLELPLALGDGVWRLADQRGRRTVMIAWAPW